MPHLIIPPRRLHPPWRNSPASRCHHHPESIADRSAKDPGLINLIPFKRLNWNWIWQILMKSHPVPKKSVPIGLRLVDQSNLWSGGHEHKSWTLNPLMESGGKTLSSSSSSSIVHRPKASRNGGGPTHSIGNNNKQQRQPQQQQQQHSAESSPPDHSIAV